MRSCIRATLKGAVDEPRTSNAALLSTRATPTTWRTVRLKKVLFCDRWWTMSPRDKWRRRHVVIGAEGGLDSFDSHAAAVRWIKREYANDNPMHVTPSAPGEVDLEQIDEDTFKVTGSWVGEEPLILTIKRAVDVHPHLRLIKSPIRTRSRKIKSWNC